MYGDWEEGAGLRRNLVWTYDGEQRKENLKKGQTYIVYDGGGKIKKREEELVGRKVDR